MHLLNHILRRHASQIEKFSSEGVLVAFRIYSFFWAPIFKYNNFDNIKAHYNAIIARSLWNFFIENLLQPGLPTNFAARKISVSACCWLEQSSVTRCFTISHSITSITYPLFQSIINNLFSQMVAIYCWSCELFKKNWNSISSSWRIFFELLRCCMILSTSSYLYFSSA